VSGSLTGSDDDRAYGSGPEVGWRMSVLPYPDFEVKSYGWNELLPFARGECPTCAGKLGYSGSYRICMHCRVQWDPLKRAESARERGGADV
jgi:hypothetical protein